MNQKTFDSRRNFLKQSALVAGASFLNLPKSGLFHIGYKPKFIVIGAGFSGLSAAYSLIRRGFDVTVLEARNRISGRVFSHNIDKQENLTVELGAEWIGYSHVRIRELCDELKLITQNSQFDTHLIYRNQYFRKGEWDFSSNWKTKLTSLLEEYRKMNEEQKENLDKLDWWRYLVNNGCEGRDLDIRELLDSTDFGESLRHISAYTALATFAESSEKNEMDLKIKGGNSKLASKLAEKIGQRNILIDHAVKRIVQNDRVSVHCHNGKIFEADKLICTIPTFAMQQIDWQPGLPTEKLNAINELQYARINKNALQFSNRFWKDESFDMITDQTPHYFYHATKNQLSKKGVLISYTTGDKAALVANQSNEWKASMIGQTLQPHFGSINTMLEKQSNYYWGDDQYSRGAYAMYGINQWTKIRPNLREAFLHTSFAGEHLAEWQGFMEGAINTGEEVVSTLV